MTRRDVRYRGFDNGFPPVIVDHLFCAGAHGELEHHIDGRLRAAVPAEGFADYLAEYPQCRPVLDAITRPQQPAEAAPPDMRADVAARPKKKALKKKR